MRIETNRLILRPLEDKDREPFAAINADPEVMRFFDHPFSREESDASFDRTREMLQKNGFHFLGTEYKDTGEFIGLIGLSLFDDELRAAIPGNPEVEIGWRLKKTVWGHGLAPEGARACLDYGWSMLHLSDVVAITYKGNIPSRRVMEKIGMHYDEKGDFRHPNLPADSRVSEHVLYRLHNPHLT